MNHFSFRVLTAAIALALASLPASATTISSGDFTGWNITPFGFDSGSGNGSINATGGNPGAEAQVDTSTSASGSASGGAAFYDLSHNTTTGSLSGSFSFSLDALAGPGSNGQGQGVYLVVVQNTYDVYLYGLGITGVPSSWTTLHFTDTFDASAFSHISGSGAATPDFSGGTSTAFGFAARNSGSGFITQYYDNFSFTYTPGSAPGVTPEPSTVALLGSGFASLAALRRRSRS